MSNKIHVNISNCNGLVSKLYTVPFIYYGLNFLQFKVQNEFVNDVFVPTSNQPNMAYTVAIIPIIPTVRSKIEQLRFSTISKGSQTRSVKGKDRPTKQIVFYFSLFM